MSVAIFLCGETGGEIVIDEFGRRVMLVLRLRSDELPSCLVSWIIIGNDEWGYCNVWFFWCLERRKENN